MSVTTTCLSANELSSTPTVSTGTPEIISLRVSSSGNSGDSNASYQPPRYSFLTGALPPSAILIDGVAAPNTSNTRIDSEVACPRMYPPRYSTVFHARSRSSGERSHPRRGQRLERGCNHTGSHSFSGPQTHEYHISTNGTKPKTWSTLKIYSRSSASSGSSAYGQKMPKFTGSDIVHGALDLDLETPHTINSINLSLRGQVITSSYDDGACTFLDLPIVSWSRANGDPRTMILPSGDDSGSSTLRTKKFDGKFLGKYSWPFSFPFPESVSLPGQNGQSNTVSPSPQTFLERGTKGNVRYELVLRMTHGILRSDSRLQVDVIYVPDILPAPSSDLRQLAYSESLSLPGPEVDPVGWYTLPPATVSGRIFVEKEVKLQCTVSLSNPQCYTRGTIIPCHISIRCKDTQALDLLSKPQSLVVRLVRRVQYYQDAGQSFIASKQGQSHSIALSGNASGNSIRGGVVEDLVQIEKAVWWVDTDMMETDENADSRQLSGEIHLGKELQPSCEFPLFKVSYTVEFFPFESPAFTISRSRTNHQITKCEPSKAILNHPVTIATLQGEGPAPIPVTPPKPRKERAVLRNSTEFNSGTAADSRYQAILF